MTEKEQLLNELERKYESMKNDMDLKVSLADLNKVFFIKDFVLEKGFVSENLSRQICYRIVDAYGSWVGYLNGLLMPNPGYMPMQAESKPFSSKEDREKIWELIRRAMELMSRNTLIGLTKDKKEESKLIEDALHFWNSEFKVELTKIIERANKQWKSTG